MKYFEDLRSLGDSETPDLYLETIKKSEADYIIVNRTQFTYLEQALIPHERMINQMMVLNINGKTIIPIRSDD